MKFLGGLHQIKPKIVWLDHWVWLKVLHLLQHCTNTISLGLKVLVSQSVTERKHCGQNYCPCPKSWTALVPSKYLRILAAGSHQFSNAGFLLRTTSGVVLPGWIRQSLHFSFTSTCLSSSSLFWAKLSSVLQLLKMLLFAVTWFVISLVHCFFLLWLQTWAQTVSVAHSAPSSTVILVMTLTCLHRQEAAPWLSRGRSKLELVFSTESWHCCFLRAWIWNFLTSVCFCAFNPIPILLVIINCEQVEKFLLLDRADWLGADCRCSWAHWKLGNVLACASAFS